MGKHMERASPSSIFPSYSERGAGWNYVYGGARADLIAARLAYIAKHGAGFLFANRPPPVPGYPRNRNWQLMAKEPDPPIL